MFSTNLVFQVTFKSSGGDILLSGYIYMIK